MLQDFVQVDLLGAGVRKRCAPPFVHVAPPTRIFPTPRFTPSPSSSTLGQPGAPPFPAPWSTPDPSFSHPCSTHAQHSSPRLHLALFAHPSCLCRLLPGLHRPLLCAPPLVRGPLVCGPPLMRGPITHGPLVCGPPLTRGPITCRPLACGPPLTRGPLCTPLPLRTPPSLLRFRYARKRGGECAGVVGHRGEVQPRWRGLPVHVRGEGTVPCASLACVQRGRQAGK